MSPRQTAGAGVRAGAGRRCPICSIPFDPSIDGWNCIHTVYAASSYAQKRIAVELAIAKRREAEDREDAFHRAGYGPPISPAAQTEDGGSAGPGLRGAASEVDALSPRPPSAGDSCLHGFDSWTDCPTCVSAADFDDGEPTWE